MASRRGLRRPAAVPSSASPAAGGSARTASAATPTTKGTACNTPSMGSIARTAGTGRRERQAAAARAAHRAASAPARPIASPPPPIVRRQQRDHPDRWQYAESSSSSLPNPSDRTPVDTGGVSLRRPREGAVLPRWPRGASPSYPPTVLAHPAPSSVTRQAARPAKGSRTFVNGDGTALAPLHGHTRRVHSTPLAMKGPPCPSIVPLEFSSASHRRASH
jgi:hypothetical protein